MSGAAAGTASSPVDLLLVEDNAEDLELTRRALQNQDLDRRLLVARDGVEALAFLARVECRPRLVLLDLKLPRIDGIEVLRRVKGDPTLQSIPVVLLSSSREPSDIAEAYLLGANSYVVKPVDPDAFAELVGAVAQYWLRHNQTHG